MVKVDTNGSNFPMITQMIEEGSVEYVAVDIKHVPNKYHLASGTPAGDHFRRNFDALLALLKTNVVDYEYRTTVID